MKRKKHPLETLPAEDREARAKVAMVLGVLSGEKSIAEACREVGLKPVLYYKIEERMFRAMLSAAAMPPRKGKRRDPLAEATALSQETEALRLEHRRLQSLMRITRKLAGSKKGKRGPGRPRKADSERPAPEAPARKAPATSVPEK